MLIGEFERNPTERIRVTVEEFKGTKRLDIRIYYKDDDEEWKPTKRGVPFRPEDIDKLADLINEAKTKL